MSNKNLSARLGCDYTTLIKLRKELEALGYIRLEARQGGKRLENVRVIPDHLANAESWPFDQFYIGSTNKDAWQGQYLKDGETANNPNDEVGETANIEDAKVGDEKSEPHGKPPKTDTQYIPLEEGVRYPSEEGKKYSSEEADFQETENASDEFSDELNADEQIETVCRVRLKHLTIRARNLLDSNEALAKHCSVKAQHVSNAMHQRSVPDRAAHMLKNGCGWILKGHLDSHPPVETFGEFGLYLPRSFREKQQGTQIAILERALKHFEDGQLSVAAYDAIQEYLFDVLETADSSSPDYGRAVRISEQEVPYPFEERKEAALDPSLDPVSLTTPSPIQPNGRGEQ